VYGKLSGVFVGLLQHKRKIKKIKKIDSFFMPKIYTYHFARESTLYPLHPIGYIVKLNNFSINLKIFNVVV